MLRLFSSAGPESNSAYIGARNLGCHSEVRTPFGPGKLVGMDEPGESEPEKLRSAQNDVKSPEVAPMEGKSREYYRLH